VACLIDQASIEGVIRAFCDLISIDQDVLAVTYYTHARKHPKPLILLTHGDVFLIEHATSLINRHGTILEF
jgi:hypothetical protein